MWLMRIYVSSFDQAHLNFRIHVEKLSSIRRNEIKLGGAGPVLLGSLARGQVLREQTLVDPLG